MIDPLIRAGVAAIVTDQVRLGMRAPDTHMLTSDTVRLQPTLVQQRLQALRAACKR